MLSRAAEDLSAFQYASCASDTPVGSIEVSGDYLILTDDIFRDGEKFYFRIDHDKLFFDAKRSAKLWDFGELGIQDGEALIYRSLE